MYQEHNKDCCCCSLLTFFFFSWFITRRWQGKQKRMVPKWLQVRYSCRSRSCGRSSFCSRCCRIYRCRRSSGFGSCSCPIHRVRSNSWFRYCFRSPPECRSRRNWWGGKSGHRYHCWGSGDIFQKQALPMQLGRSKVHIRWQVVNNTFTSVDFVWFCLLQLLAKCSRLRHEARTLDQCTHFLFLLRTLWQTMQIRQIIFFKPASRRNPTLRAEATFSRYEMASEK